MYIINSHVCGQVIKLDHRFNEVLFYRIHPNIRGLHLEWGGKNREKKQSKLKSLSSYLNLQMFLFSC